MTQEQLDAISISLECEKEVFTVKNDKTYYGVIKGEKEFLVCLQGFDSPLKASNHARSVKRKIGVESKPVEKSKPVELKKPVAPVTRTRLAKKRELFTEAEMTARTDLHFREVWVILSLNGQFVSESLKNNKVVRYSNNKDKAEVFNSYEEAMFKLKTLDMVIKKGHRLRRYFEKAR